jgi:hypothetical protein
LKSENQNLRGDVYGSFVDILHMYRGACQWIKKKLKELKVIHKNNNYWWG